MLKNKKLTECFWFANNMCLREPELEVPIRKCEKLCGFYVDKHEIFDKGFNGISEREYEG